MLFDSLGCQPEEVPPLQWIFARHVWQNVQMEHKSNKDKPDMLLTKMLRLFKILVDVVSPKKVDREGSLREYQPGVKF